MGAAAADSLRAMLDPLARLAEVAFGAPERLWMAGPLVLVLVLAPLARRGRPRVLALLLRAAVIFALLGALLEPTLPDDRVQPGKLIVVADVSPSVGKTGLEQTRALLEQARAPFELIAAGDAPRIVATLEASDRPGTDLAAALRLAAARAAPDRPTRVVLVSDGRATEPGTQHAALQLRGARTELWTMGVPARAPEPVPEVSVSEISLPPMRDRRQPFWLKARVRATADARVRATLYLDGTKHREQQVALSAGDGEIVFSGLSLPPGRYHAQVLLGGRAAGTTLVVKGPPRVLLLARAARRALLADALATQGMQTEVRSVAEATDLEGYDAVVLLPDAPALELEKRSAQLADFVGRRGGGLLAIGGSEGPGLARLHATPTAHLLPLDVPPRAQPKPAPPSPEPSDQPKVEIVEEKTEAYPITLCLVVDRSGSMHGRKMRQAKAAAAAAARALTSADRIAVVAFGDAAVLAMTPRRAGDPRAVMAALAPLEARGKTAMFAALSLGFAVLHREKSPIRHLVLISDGIPTDDGRWKDLVLAMVDQKITLSSVGIGFEIDTHLLGRLATWGHGKYWLANQPRRVPQVVTQDTQRLVSARDRRGRDAERSRPKPKPERKPQPKPRPEPKQPPATAVRIVLDPGAPREMFRGLRQEDLPEVAGFERGKLRFASWTAARAGEGGPPLVAYGRVGLGTVAVLTLDPEARGARALREAEEFPRIMAQLLRSILPDARGEPLLVKHELSSNTLSVAILGEDGMPRTDLALGAQLDGEPLAIVRRAGRFEIALPRRTQPGRIDLKIGSILTRSLVVPASPDRESIRLGVDRATLRRLAGESKRLDAPAATTLIRPARVLPVRKPAELPFLLLAGILLPFDAWARRRASR